MHKTKFGISVGLLGAIICTLTLFVGIEWYVLAIMGYVLITEQNEWLKRFIVKILIIISIVWLLDAGFDIISNFLSWLNSIFNSSLKFPWSINNKIMDIITIAKNVILLFMAISAFNQKHIKIAPIDKIINKNV